ncbi:MAG: diaminohydroxyphosphoribosylaminopyrimidine deaminase [Parasphingorhabdus sp.]|jgi:diaminohydroxyphosphoribosylaminopyrimidine deaminase/5-amino-6-(5-phosphoribosylamino)uracil reductase
MIDHHSKLMMQAIQLAQNSMTISKPNPRVGCVIVRDGEIVGEGWTQRAGQAHAEIEALRNAGDLTRGADVYVSLEPCCHFGKTGPCTEALVLAGVRRVFVAMIDPNAKVSGAGVEKLKSAGIDVQVGLCEIQARQLNTAFIHRMTTGRPLVRLKMAATMDGHSGDHAGVSQWITGSGARHEVHRMRGNSGAVVTGVGSVLSDNPSLNARLDKEVVQPMRVVLDSNLRTPVESKLFSNPGRVVLVSRDVTVGHHADAEVLRMPSATTGIDLEGLLTWLAEQQCNDIMVEAGPRLCGSFLAQQLVDEIVLFLAPKFLGIGGQGLLQLSRHLNLAEAIEFETDSCEQVENDVMIKLTRKRSAS